jgi:hypothetical protein
LLTYKIRNYSDPLKIEAAIDEAKSFFLEKYKMDKSLCYLDIVFRKTLKPSKTGRLNLIDLT